MRHPSYIGITGLCSQAEVRAALDAFPACGRQLMVGVLASAKTLSGQPVKHWRRHPKPSDIAGLFLDDPRCLNLVHYASDEPPAWDAIRRLHHYAGYRCHGFQWNISWPRPADLLALEVFRHRCGYTSTRCVLQVGPKLIAACQTLDDLVKLVEPYRSRTTDVLLDFSGGRGEPVDVHMARVAILVLGHAFPTLGVSIAGGLCAETIPPVARLIADGAGCDAEGRLRDDADGGGDLVQEKVSAYLAATAEACR